MKVSITDGEALKIWLQLYAAVLTGTAAVANRTTKAARECAEWAAEVADAAFTEYLERGADAVRQAVARRAGGVGKR